MDWTYPRPAEGRGEPEGLDEVLRRLAAGIGAPPPAGTRFLFDRREMMEATREIELAAEGTLLVGFQRADKFDGERQVYEAIAARGVEITAFGAGRPSDPGKTRWIEIPFDVRPLENQWFLVIGRPEPLAFVSYELSEPDRFGTGGVSDRERTFAGFVSRDARVVEALRRHLAGVARIERALVEPPPEVLGVARGARSVLVATDDGIEGPSAAARRGAIGLAKALDAELILYDRSAESYLVDPYPYPEVLDGTRTLDGAEVTSLGRPHLADQIEEAGHAGVHASAWLPRRPGPRGMTDLVAWKPVGVLVLPEGVTRPSLFDRIRGEVLSKWREVLPAPIVVAGRGGELRTAAPPRNGARVRALV